MRSLAALLLFLLTASAAAPREKIFMIPGFDRVRIDGPFEVVIAQGTTRASAVGDERQLERLDIRVDGNILVVSAGPEGWRVDAGAPVAAAKVTLRTPALRAIVVNGGGVARIEAMRGTRVDLGLNGAGGIQVGAVTADDLGVTLIGSGGIILGGTARSARMRTSGAGSIDGAALIANDAVLVNESAGSLVLGVRYSVQVNALGLGMVRILGTPECTIRGAGPVQCDGRVVRR